MEENTMARERTGEVTFQDIANFTGFSKTTISRYFNHPGTVSEENRKTIEKALSSLNYSENRVARMLAKGKTDIIGLIIPNLYNGFYQTIQDLLIGTYDKYGYKFLVLSGSDSESRERRYISELLAYRIEGLIILSHTIPSSELAGLGIPVVGIEREDRYISSVSTDNHMGGVQAAKLLYENDCDEYIILNSPTATDVPAFGRVRGFVETVQGFKKPQTFLEYEMDSEYETMVDSIEKIMKNKIINSFPGKRKGIFCLSDSSAIVVLNYLFRTYGCLPEDYRIIGFDNTPASKEAVLPLSTVGQQVEILVDTAMSILLDEIRTSKEYGRFSQKDPVHAVIPPRLISRETTD